MSQKSDVVVNWKTLYHNFHFLIILFVLNRYLTQQAHTLFINGRRARNCMQSVFLFYLFVHCGLAVGSQSSVKAFYFKNESLAN